MTNAVIPLNERNSKRAVQFLQTYAPNGPWCLTAINPDKKELVTATFYPGDEEKMLAWIEERNGGMNLYFHVNSVIGKLTKKAEREQIASVDYLHVDIDPKPGRDLPGEQQRILNLLTTGLKKLMLPVPTFVTFSGGGYQAFWKLATPIRIDGNLGKAEDAKLYNKQLEILFGADNCHNIDRIMRLPGTINLPDAKKRAAGRVPALARAVLESPDAVYDLSRFSKAVQTTNDLQSHEVDLGISGNVTRITDLNDLEQWEVPDRVKIIIAQGHDPDNPKKGDNSRSAWLFDALCQLVRANVPPEVMYALITDPDWDISKSILDKGRGADAYARRQIARALTWAINPALPEMNDKHFTVILGGKFRVARVHENGDIEYWDKSTFKDYYAVKEIEIGKHKDGTPIRDNLASWWLGQPKRRSYDGISFGEKPNHYNLWTGFSVDARPGDCAMFKEYVRKIVCRDREREFEYLWRLLAWKVQNPTRHAEIAVVLRGNEGTGKGFLARSYGSLFGRHFLQTSSSETVVGNFNLVLMHTAVLLADEAFFAGDKKSANRLKGTITEPTMVIEKKGVDAFTADNHLLIFLASNETQVINAGADARRFFVLEPSEERKGDHDYFGKLAASLEAGGREALLHELLTTELPANWHPRAHLPKTEELGEQKALTALRDNPVLDWVHETLAAGTFDHDGVIFRRPVVYKERLLRLAYSGTLGPRNKVARTMAALGWAGDFHPDSDDRKAVWVPPPLDIARSKFEAVVGSDMAWGELKEWIVLERGEIVSDPRDLYDTAIVKPS